MIYATSLSNCSRRSGELWAPSDAEFVVDHLDLWRPDDAVTSLAKSHAEIDIVERHEQCLIVAADIGKQRRSHHRAGRGNAGNVLLQQGTPKIAAVPTRDEPIGVVCNPANADDHAGVLDVAARVMEQRPDHTDTIEPHSGQEALDPIRRHDLDIVVHEDDVLAFGLLEGLIVQPRKVEGPVRVDIDADFRIFCDLVQESRLLLDGAANIADHHDDFEIPIGRPFQQCGQSRDASRPICRRWASGC